METQLERPHRRLHKKPFNVDTVFRRIEEAIAPFPKAMLFELADRGYRDVFQQLVACVISVRTLDEVSLESSLRLFDLASTSRRVAALDEREIDELIRPATFHRQKSKTIRNIAREIETKYKGDLPCTREALLEFKGVGPKCAALVLGVACEQPYIAVDTHVHRITNRWGYVRTSSPEQTRSALESKLPTKYAIDINRLLVPFGKHICTWNRPKCSECPVLGYCKQVGVTNPR